MSWTPEGRRCESVLAWAIAVQQCRTHTTESVRRRFGFRDNGWQDLAGHRQTWLC